MVEILQHQPLVKVVPCVDDDGPCYLPALVSVEWARVPVVLAHDAADGPDSLVVFVPLTEQGDKVHGIHCDIL